MVAIVTHNRDIHGKHVARILRAREEKVVLLDYSRFPRSTEFTFQDGRMLEIRFEGTQALETSSIKSVLNRRQALPCPVKGTSRKVKEYVVRESRNFLDALPSMLPVFWVSDPDLVAKAARKPYHFAQAQELGFKVPRTLITNSPDAALEFARDIERDVAVKTLWTPSITTGRGKERVGFVLYTRRLRSEQLKEIAGNIKNCPIIIQEYVEKRVELRITVVGRRLFACAIHSQQSSYTKEDWRRYDIANTPHEPYDLPKDISHKCLQLVRSLGLEFGCIDMIVTPEGQHIFLEINPNGQWLWIEQLTRMPISEALADLLANPEANKIGR